MRLLRERLGTVERAAYVLRAAFGHPYGQIARMLHTMPGTTRQLVGRARRHLARGRCVTVTSAQYRRLSTAFVAAARTGNTACLIRLLTDTTGTGGEAAPVPARGARGGRSDRPAPAAASRSGTRRTAPCRAREAPRRPHPAVPVRVA
ncbi:sigma factor-like helix-turn-helix DNA-binding protein [Streptomyces griseoincarnatus]|uniref:sigma factor-like helix-turn-helix DNA-binding protein n=1 Tax=Streptomyces sp. BSE7-9 TaxID=2759948 RepID=UPI0013D306ED|nr:sigma factor-like helix-turn-helix DNA-binding protein [Streptomyces sp. BSE7-9]NEA92771.1 hypothetical protein [Actinospica acidiphila]